MRTSRYVYVMCAGLLGLFGLLAVSAAYLGKGRDTFAEMTSALGAPERQSFSEGSFVATFHPQPPGMERATFTARVAFDKYHRCLSYHVESQSNDADDNLGAVLRYTGGLMWRTTLHCLNPFGSSDWQSVAWMHNEQPK